MCSLTPSISWRCQMVVAIGVAVAVAYSFPNGAPLRRAQPLSVALLSQRLLPQWPSSDVKHRDPPPARRRISWTDAELWLPLQVFVSLLRR